MLPRRPVRYLFAAALAAACLSASAGRAQSFDASGLNGPAQAGNGVMGGKLKLGAATIDLRHSLQADRPVRDTELSDSREESSSATFSLNLGGNGGSSLFPEMLNFSARKTDIFGEPRLSVDSIASPDPYDKSKTDYIISADWGAPEDRFSFSFSSSSLDDGTGTGEYADVNDDMLNFTRTLQTGGWLSSFTASVGRGYRGDTGNRERTRKIGASASFKTLPGDAPQFDITARVFQDRSEKLDAGDSGVDTRWEFRTGSELFGGAARGGLTTQPSLSIFFSVKGNAADQAAPDPNPIDVSAGVTGRVHF